MRVSLIHDGLEVATGKVGQTIGIPGLTITPADIGWSMMVPEGSIALPGHYEIIAMPVNDEPDPIEFEPLTPEQQRYLMPVIYPTDFARLLQGLRTENYPEGVLPSDVEAIIDAIPDKATRELARWDFNRAGTYERKNEWIDIIGAEFPMTPEEMDVAWMAFVGAEA